MAMLWYMKPVRGLQNHHRLLSFTRESSSKTSTFSSVCHLHISHVPSTLALRLSHKFIFSAFNFRQCALAMKI